jgi:hypothetical protein
MTSSQTGVTATEAANGETRDRNDDGRDTQQTRRLTPNDVDR